MIEKTKNAGEVSKLYFVVDRLQSNGFAADRMNKREVTMTEETTGYSRLCDSDFRFMCVVWENAPVNSGNLVKLCEEKLGWKKSTTYTVLRKLCEKGYLANRDALVTVLIPKQQVLSEESEFFVERVFDGSLPRFLAAFLGGKSISAEEAKLLKKLIDEHRE